MKRIAIMGTLCEKSMLICVISDINHVYPKISHQIYILTVLLVNLGVQIRDGEYVYTLCRKQT